jgi:hypothetical protein
VESIFTSCRLWFFSRPCQYLNAAVLNSLYLGWFRCEYIPDRTVFCIAHASYLCLLRLFIVYLTMLSVTVRLIVSYFMILLLLSGLHNGKIDECLIASRTDSCKEPHASRESLFCHPFYVTD